MHIYAYDCPATSKVGRLCFFFGFLRFLFPGFSGFLSFSGFSFPGFFGFLGFNFFCFPGFLRFFRFLGFFRFRGFLRFPGFSWLLLPSLWLPGLSLAEVPGCPTAPELGAGCAFAMRGTRRRRRHERLGRGGLDRRLFPFERLTPGAPACQALAAQQTPACGAGAPAGGEALRRSSACGGAASAARRRARARPPGHSPRRPCPGAGPVWSARRGPGRRAVAATRRQASRCS